MFWPELLLSQSFGPHTGPCQVARPWVCSHCSETTKHWPASNAVSAETRMIYFWSPLGVMKLLCPSPVRCVCLLSAGPISLGLSKLLCLNRIPDDLPSLQVALPLPFSVLQTLQVTQTRNTWNQEGTYAIHFSAILSGRTKPDISYAKVEHVANRNNRTKNDTFPTSCKDEQFTVNIHWAVVIYSVDMEFLALSRISATCLSSEHSSVSTMKSLCK